MFGLVLVGLVRAEAGSSQRQELTPGLHPKLIGHSPICTPEGVQMANIDGSQVWFDRFNDPSAGSPTETLLRLLLPLGGRV